MKAGQILFTLDPRPFQIALDNAKADLAQSVLDVQSAEAEYKGTLAQSAAESAQVRLASHL